MMKTLIKTVLLLQIVGIMGVSYGVGKSNPKEIFEKIKGAKTSTNVTELVQLSNEVETLWPDFPKEYFQAIRKMGSLQGRHLTNNVTKNSIKLDYLDHAMDKRPLGDPQKDWILFEQKDHLALSLLLSARNDRVRLLKVAQYMGDIRRSRIPNYIYKDENKREDFLDSVISDNSNSNSSVSLFSITGDFEDLEKVKKLNPQQLKIYKKLKARDDANLHMNDLQNYLYLWDRAQKFRYRFFVTYIKRHPKDQQFIKDLEKAAELTKEEVEIFKNAKNIRSDDPWQWPKVALMPRTSKRYIIHYSPRSKTKKKATHPNRCFTFD